MVVLLVSLVSNWQVDSKLLTDYVFIYDVINAIYTKEEQVKAIHLTNYLQFEWPSKIQASTKHHYERLVKSFHRQIWIWNLAS